MDRHSQLGIVEIDLTALVEDRNRTSTTPTDDMRVDPLRPPKKGSKAQGMLTYSVQFFPLHHSAVVDKSEGGVPTLAEKKAARKADSLALPIFHLSTKLAETFEPEPFDWEKDRIEKRKETVRWVTGQREREILEIEEKPSEERRSGILAWNVLSLQDLQVRALTGDFKKSETSGAGGKPALAELTANVEGLEEEPVSSYVEVRPLDSFSCAH